MNSNNYSNLDKAFTPVMSAEFDKQDSVRIDFDKPWRMNGDVFTAKRLPDDRDLVQCITLILERVGHPDPTGWTRNAAIELAKTMPPEGQIFLINRYWRMFLAEMPFDTMLQRRALMDIVASYSDYLNAFEVAVAPYIVPKTFPSTEPNDKEVEA